MTNPHDHLSLRGSLALALMEASLQGGSKDALLMPITRLHKMYEVADEIMTQEDVHETLRQEAERHD